MYTGTLINDLMATVERAEQRARQTIEDKELRMLEAIYAAALQHEPVLVGAA